MGRLYLNNDWEFTTDFTEDFFDNKGGNYQKVRIPHTCRELPYDYFSEETYQMVCGYRTVLYVPKQWQNKKVLLTIDGAAHFAEVFVNGTLCGTHACGYTAFTLDISECLEYGGDNMLVVKVDSRESLNIPPFGHVIDYMTYGGIYREVYLEIKEQNYIEDVFMKPEISGNYGCEIKLAGGMQDGFKLRQAVYFQGQAVYGTEVPVIGNEMTLEGFVEGVQLWDVDAPNLYDVKTELVSGDKILDEKNIRVGFRSARFEADGFWLNGRKLKIRGLNRHQSYPYVGYAMPKSIQEFDAEVLKKELGLNAVRTSHYPQSHAFIDRCDELGLLVFTEIPGWQHIGDALWKEQAVKNVEEMVCQYRNHPSIVLWGVRINESKDDEKFYLRTNETAHRLDDTRQTGGVRAIRKSQLLEDVYTYNDFVHDGTTPGCVPKASVTSDKGKPYLVTEYGGHMFPTKSFDCEEHRVEHALRHARVLNAVASYEDICGSFGWCMADYNTHKDFGSGDRICHHGVLDMFRNPKTAAFVYASQQQEIPVLEVSSSMDIGEHPASKRGEVWIFSNADSVKMYKNDRLLKEYKPEQGPFSHLQVSPMLVDDYVGNALVEQEGFSKGKAKAVTEALNYIALYGYTRMTPGLIRRAVKCVLLYRMSIQEITGLYTKYIGDWGETATEYRFEAIKDGKVVKTVTKTPMKQTELEVQVSSEILEEKETFDATAVRIRALDEHGNLLHFCGDPLKLFVEGPIELIGPDMISLKGGMGGTYVKTIGESGSGVLTIEGSRFETVKVTFEVK